MTPPQPAPSTPLIVGGRRLEHAWHGPPRSPRTPLVFLHEGLGCVSMWRDFPERVAAATRRPALVYSRAGHGASDPVERAASMSFLHDESAVLGGVLEQTQIGDAILVGHSDGGSIALIHAALDGARVRALVLEAPHVFCEELTQASIAAAAEAYRHGDLREKLARHHGANVDAAFWGWNRAWLAPATRHWTIADLLPRVRVPVLVIQGEQDRYGTLRQVDAIAERSAGPVERLVLRDCGHAPHRDQPEPTLAAITRFLERVDGG